MHSQTTSENALLQTTANSLGRTYIDLSVPIETDVDSDPPQFRPKISFREHKETVEELAEFFPGLQPSDLPEGQGWAYEILELNTHNGTHMDAPWHFHATQDAALEGGARPSLTIDKVPLDWCMRPAVKLDFRHFADGYVATGDDVQRELDRIGYTLKPLDIVLVNTRAGELYGHDGYVAAGCGMGRDATMHLTKAGVRVVGTDAWSWDAPFVHTAERWAANRDPAIIWEGHKAGLEIGYFQMEKLHNLEILPSFGYEICCFPIKIKDASAGWIRAVAIVDELS